MASLSTISTLPFCCSSSLSARICKSSMYSTIPSCSSSSSPLYLKTLNFSLSSSFSQMGFCSFSPWNGLRHMGISISPNPRKMGNRGKCKGKVVYASLFGVGAPEALVIGVVALLVFGPKGLAELARNLGKTLRTFQPTIRELQEVSKEFKSALEREISLDDDPSLVNNTNGSSNANLTSDGAPVTNNAYSLEESLRIQEEQYKALTTVPQDIASSPSENQIEVDSQPQDIALPGSAYTSEEYLKITEEQLKALATTQQDASNSPSENQIEIESRPQATIEESATVTPPVQKTESQK